MITELGWVFAEVFENQTTIKKITSDGIADLQTEKLRQIYEKSVEVTLA